MASLRSATVFALLGFLLLAAHADPLRAAPDQTLGMTLMTASVNSSGNVVFASGGVAGELKVGTGNYLIHFNRPLATCTCTASLGHRAAVHEGGFPPSWISCNVPDVYYPSSVRVFTALSGSSADASFHVIVFCPK